MRSLRELLEDLEARGRVPPGTLERASLALAAEAEKTPWFLALLMGAGAWLATICFLLGAAALLDFDGGAVGWAIVALLFLAFGLGARRLSGKVFSAQFSLGLSLAGWSAGVFAGGELVDVGLGGFAIAGVVLAALVYLLHPDAILRFLVSLASLSLLSLWLILEADGEFAIARNVPAILSALGVGLLFTRPGLSRLLVPLGQAFAVLLAVTLPLLNSEFGGRRELVPTWPSVLALTIALGLVLRRLLLDGGPDLRRSVQPLCFAAVAALGLACCFGGPSLLAAILLLVLGHGAAIRSIEVLGLLALPVALVLFYHDLQVDLLTKSGIIIASGGVLLFLRHLLSRQPWADAAS